MRKVFFSTAALMIGGLMLHGAFACELNRHASQPNWAIDLPGACSGSNCLVNLPQDVDQVQNCDAAYFDPGSYSGTNGLLDWLMASFGTQKQYRSVAGLAPPGLQLEQGAGEGDGLLIGFVGGLI
jgi:hypothetical protein